MKFSDLLPGRVKRQVGRVTRAEWDQAERGIRFTIQFEPSGRRVEGVCRAGHDPVSGSFVAERDLRAKLPLLATYLGHQHLSGTQRYLHFTAELFPEVMRRVEATFGDVIPRRTDS